MGKRRDRRYGWKLAVLTLALLCLCCARGQAYAQEDKEEEHLIRYSSSYLKAEEIPEAPEEYLEESGSSYRLVGTEIETVPVRGRKKEVSGEILYPAVTREQEIPKEAPLAVEDRESRKSISVMLPLQRISYENESWQEDFVFTVVFHEYGADTYRVRELTVAHDSEVPPLEECQKELLASAGLKREETEIEAVRWEGEAYQDETGIWCRNAAVQARRRVWDCRAIYGGMIELPAYERCRMRMEYEKTEPDADGADETAEQAESMVETESLPVENIPLPFWRRWIRYGLAISVSLLLILLACLGLRRLLRMARDHHSQ